MACHPKCLELAGVFFPEGGSDHLTAELAQHIHNEIRNWLLLRREKINKELREAGHADLV